MTGDVVRSSGASPTVVAVPDAHAIAGPPTAGSLPGVLVVHVRNVTGGVQRVVVSVLGLERGWLPDGPMVAEIPPGATTTYEVRVVPTPGAAPGEYPCSVVVDAGPGDRTVAESSFRVDGASDVVLSVEPAHSTGVRSRTLQVVVGNASSVPVVVRLTAGSDAGSDLHLSRTEVRVGPRATVRLRGTVRARGARVTGPTARHDFWVGATGERAPKRVQGVFVSRPLLGGRFLRAVALLTVACLWIAGGIVFLPRIVGSLTQDEGSTTVSRQDAGSGGGDDGGSGGSDDGSGGDGGGAGGDDGGPGGGSGGDGGDDGGDGSEAAAAGVRIAGLVKGAEPSGVDVQIAPASALAAAPASAADAAADVASGLPLPWPGTVGATGDGAATVADVALHDEGRTVSTAGKVWSAAVPVEDSSTLSARRSTLTSDAGTWSFAGLSASGRYLVSLAKAGYQTQRYVVTGAEAASTPLELTLEPGQGKLSGTVTGPGGAVGGVEVVITDGTTTVTTRSATSGDVGRWAVDGLSTPTTYLVSAGSARLGTRSSLVRLDAAGQDTVDLALRPGVASLTGTVNGRDALGDVGPLGGITVTARQGKSVRSATTVTGEGAGRFVLPDLPVPGRYTVTVTGDGYLPLTRTVNLTAGSSTKPLQAQLTAIGGSVVGTVREKGGGFLTTGVTLSSAEATYKVMSSTTETVSGAERNVRFDGVAPGTYVVSAESFGHVTAYGEVVVRSGRPSAFGLRLAVVEDGGLQATAQIRGRVTDAGTGGQIECPGIPEDECVVTVRAEVVGLDGKVTRPKVTSVPDDPYLFPGGRGLLPGRYHLEVSAPGYEPGSVDVKVAMGATVEAATVALYPSPAIEGRILARVGTVPDDTCVVAVRSGSPAPTAADCSRPRTDDSVCAIDTGSCAYARLSGEYELVQLASGTYDTYVLTPADSEYLSVDRVRITLQPGDVRRYDATVDRYGRFAVSVLTPGDGGVNVAAPGAEVVVTDQDGKEFAGPTTDESGASTVVRLPTGTYTPTVTYAGTTVTGLAVPVNLNQDVPTQLVVAGRQDRFAGTVSWQAGTGAPTPVDDATVKVTGVVDYRGSQAVYGSATVTTDANGAFVVCTQSPCDDGGPVDLTLLSDTVSVVVSATGYVDLRADGVSVDEGLEAVLVPRGVAFRGTVALSPDAAAMAERHDGIELDVVAPPGAGTLRPTVDAQGRIVWFDSGQPSDTTAGALPGARTILPGTYTVSARLSGYSASAPVTFHVAPDQVADSYVALELLEDGSVRLDLVTTQVHGTATGSGLGEPEPVTGATVTLTRVGATGSAAAPTVWTARAGVSYVDVGPVPVGSYRAVVSAPGHLDTSPRPVVITAGSVAGTAVQQESLVRLGSISGKVLRSFGDTWTQDLPGAAIRAEGPGGPFGSTSGLGGTYTLAGTATQNGLFLGDWSVEAALHGYDQLPPVDVDVDTSGTLEQLVAPAPDLTLTATKKDVVVYVIDADQEFVPGLRLQLIYRDGDHEIKRVLECSGTAPDDGCPTATGPEEYRFVGLEPVTYTLYVTGAGWSPISVEVPSVPGVGAVQTVPLAAPPGSLQGIVSLRSASGSTAPLADAAVTLTPLDSSGDPLPGLPPTTTDANGRYEFRTVPSGTYEVKASAKNLDASRRLTVSAGQGVVADLLLEEATRQVRVVATSVNGYDLAGALVTLGRAETDDRPAVELAAQPVAPAAGGTFATTFNQVPPGDWTITLTGPANHLGSTVATAHLAAGGGDDPVPFPIAVRETRLSLRAVSALADPPDEVTATVTTGGQAGRPVSLPVGGGDVVVYVPQTGATVTGAVASPYTVGPPVDVPAAATAQRVTFTVAGAPTSTTLSRAGSGPVDVGGSVVVTVGVAQGGDAVTRGRVVVETTTGTGGGATWDAMGSVDLAAAGRTVTVTLDDPGTTRLRARYEGDGPFGASTSDVLSIGVRVPTSVALSPAVCAAEVGGSVDVGVTLTAESGAAPSVGTVTLRRTSPDDETTTLRTVDLADATLPASWPVIFAAAGSYTLTADYDGAGVWRDAAAVSRTCTITTPEPEPTTDPTDEPTTDPTTEPTTEPTEETP